MELRQYGNVIWRRKWLVVAIIVIAAAFSAYLLLSGGRTYNQDIVLTTRQELTPNDTNGGIFTFDRYYNWIASEYMVDDLTQLIESDSFGKSVLDELKAEVASGKIEEVQTDKTKLNMDKLKADVDKLLPSDIVAYTGSDRRQRELRVFVVAPSRDMASAILNAAGVVLTGNKLVPIRGQFTDKPILAQIDTVNLEKAQSSASKDITNAIIRVIMGIAAAIALVFLLEYLDNSVRDERDAKRVLDLPVLGAIPRV